MVGNRFAYISRMGQIESWQKKFMIILFLREFLKKIMKSIWNLFLYMGKKIPELSSCHRLAKLLK